MKDAARDESLQDIKNHPRLASGWLAYADFGTDLSKFYCFIESPAKRVQSTDQLHYINTLVAVFSCFSLKYIVPSGGDGLHLVDGDLRLTLAKGNESLIPLVMYILSGPPAKRGSLS